MTGKTNLRQGKTTRRVLAGKRLTRLPKFPLAAVAGQRSAVASSPLLSQCFRFGHEFAKNRELLKLVTAYYAFFGIAAAVLVGGVLVNSGTSLLGGKASLSTVIAQFGGLVLAGTVLLVLFAIAGLWVNSFMTATAGQLLKKGKFDLQQSKAIASNRFVAVLGVALLSVVASFAVSPLAEAIGMVGGKVLASIVDFIFSLAVSLALLYAPFEAVLHNRGAFSAVRSSIARFGSRPLQTALLFVGELAVLALAAIVALLAVVFAILFAAAAFGALGAGLPAVLVAVILGALAFSFLLSCLAFATQFSVGLIACAVEAN